MECVVRSINIDLINLKSLAFMNNLITFVHDFLNTVDNGGTNLPTRQFYDSPYNLFC